MPALLGPDVILNTMQYRVGVNLRRQIPNLFIRSSVTHDATAGKFNIMLSSTYVYKFIYYILYMS